MRICCVIATLGPGGAERVMSALASHWASSHCIRLVTLSDAAEDAYPLAPSIERVGLGVARPSRTAAERLRHNWMRVRALRTQFRQFRPDVVVSFTDRTNILALVAATGLDVPVVVSERTYPPAHSIGAVWRLLRVLLYRRAATLVVQTERSARWARRIVSASAVKTIPNPVSPEILAAANTECARVARSIVAVGRLEYEKGFDLLIQAFAAATRTQPDWVLTIVGSGSKESELKRFAQAAAPAGSVRFVPATRDVGSHLRRSELFVLSSRYEGFPNVLIEAMTCGCAVVAADCTAGPSEIIENGCTGVLVPAGDIVALERAISTLIVDQRLRESLAAAAQAAAARYGLAQIGREWLDTFDQVRNGPAEAAERHGNRAAI